MKRYRISISPDVEESINSQFAYIALDSIDRALAWKRRLHMAIKDIANMPGKCAVDEAISDRLGQEIRKMTFERTYLVYYRINEPMRTIEIHHFRHGAQYPYL